jgi:hypothetical protein
MNWTLEVVIVPVLDNVGFVFFDDPDGTAGRCSRSPPVGEARST